MDILNVNICVKDICMTAKSIVKMFSFAIHRVDVITRTFHNPSTQSCSPVEVLKQFISKRYREGLCILHCACRRSNYFDLVVLQLD